MKHLKLPPLLVTLMIMTFLVMIIHGTFKAPLVWTNLYNTFFVCVSGEVVTLRFLRAITHETKITIQKILQMELAMDTCTTTIKSLIPASNLV